MRRWRRSARRRKAFAIVSRGQVFTGAQCVISAGRSGSKWMETVCRDLQIPTRSNRVDIGVRVELPAEVFAHPTGRAVRVQNHLSDREIPGSRPHLLHEPARRGGQREHQRHRDGQRALLRGSRQHTANTNFAPAGFQAFFRSRSRIPTAMANRWRGCPICWAAA